MARTVANPRGSTRGQYSFAQVPNVGLQRSVFNRSCNLKTAFDAAWLVPIFLDEALPGDTFKMRMTYFARMQRPVVPLMDNLYLDIFFFAVPNRLLWDNWHKFMGAQDDPGDSIAFTIPITTAYTVAVGGLPDYMGVPPSTTNPITHNLLPLRAYALIFNEWFRDENLTNSIHFDTGNGPEPVSSYLMQKRAKRHDYFTSCLPWTQKGDAVNLPLGTTAPLTITGDGEPTFDHGATTNDGLQIGSVGGDVEMQGTSGSVGDDLSWNDPKLEVDLTGATAATINEIREAFQIQRLLERDARAGTRYTEIIRSHFHVVSPDARMQRPEFLGGGSARVQVAPVASTDAAAGAPGDLGSYAVVGSSQPSFYKSFTEHCYIIGLANVRADLTYQEGLNRLWKRETRYDFYWPTLANLGEQEVFNQEIYMDGSANDTDAFGFQERYAEYRYKPSEVTAQMRSVAGASSLDYWHLALEFGSLPALNNTFIEDAPPLDRVVAVITEPEFFMDAHFEYKCARPMPTFSVPGMVDHF